MNNAGITRDGLLMKMSGEDFDAVLDTNLKGAFHCIRHVARQMVKQRAEESLTFLLYLAFWEMQGRLIILLPRRELSV